MPTPYGATTGGLLKTTDLKIWSGLNYTEHGVPNRSNLGVSTGELNLADNPNDVSLYNVFLDQLLNSSGLYGIGESRMDAMTFFAQSAGRWQSQRTTHHLPFRRAESGGSEITVETLDQRDPRVVEICQMHEIDPELAVGGAYVTWDGSMAWDREGEDHAGSTVFALVPDAADGRTGRLLRERGYAEIVPVVGRYEMDAEDALNLITEYETMSVVERFWFVNPNLRLRTSAVKRFGGFNTATFCAESRCTDEASTTDLATDTAAAMASLVGW